MSECRPGWISRYLRKTCNVVDRDLTKEIGNKRQREWREENFNRLTALTEIREDTAFKNREQGVVPKQKKKERKGEKKKERKGRKERKERKGGREEMENRNIQSTKKFLEIKT